MPKSVLASLLAIFLCGFPGQSCSYLWETAYNFSSWKGPWVYGEAIDIESTDGIYSQLDTCNASTVFMDFIWCIESNAHDGQAMNYISNIPLYGMAADWSNYRKRLPVTTAQLSTQQPAVRGKFFRDLFLALVGQQEAHHKSTIWSKLSFEQNVKIHEP